MKLQITGHRGARNEAPENTLAGFRHAISLGLTAVEFDVRLTSDQELVVIHDADVDRTTNGTGSVADMTHAELAALDARAQFTEWPEPCPIPTLADVLDLLGGMPTMMIELKSDTPERLEQIAGGILQHLDERDIGDQATLTSFDPVALEIVQRLAPSRRRGLIGAWDTEDFIEAALGLGCVQADVNLTTSSAIIVERARNAGLRTIAWPCNSAEALEIARDWHVDAITTDVPTTMLKLVTGYETQ